MRLTLVLSSSRVSHFSINSKIAFNNACVMFNSFMPSLPFLRDNPTLKNTYSSSTAAYEDSDDYEAWLDFLANGGTTAEWNGKKGTDNEYLRNNLPKGFEDTRIIGRTITAEELDDIIQFAKEKGVQIGHHSNPTGGFENYCGDIYILKEIIEETAKQQNSSLFRKMNADKPILCYENVLGFYGDFSKIDVGAFASTKGKTITLNKFMFDDSKYLKAEYKSSAEQGMFVKGTSYINIIDHEAGHIIEKYNPKIRRKVISVLEKEAMHENIDLAQYIVNNISLYAADLNSKGEYHELVAEINSLLTIGNNSNIIKLLEKEGVL